MRALVGFLTSAALLMLANGISTPTVVAKLTSAGIGGGLVGIVLAASSLGFAFSATFGGRLVGTWGARGVLAASAGLLAAALLGQLAFTSPLLIGGARAAAGAAVALACLAIEPGLGRAAGARRGLVFGLYLVVSNLALALGPLFDGLGPQALGAAAGFAVLAGGSSALAPSRERGGVAGRRNRLDPVLLVRRAPGAAVAALGGGAAVGALLGVAPLHASELGLGPSLTRAFLVALVGLGGIVPLPLGLLADRRDRDRVILGSAILLTGCALLAATLPAPLSVLALVLAGGFAFALYPLGLGLAQERLTAEEMPRASGALLLSYALGSTVGPPVAGALLEASGPPALPLWVALAGSIAILGPALRGATARWGRPAPSTTAPEPAHVGPPG